MACQRCGGRMLSRVGSSRLALVCTDCGTPQPSAPDPSRPHPVVIGLTLVGMSAFALLLFILTNWRPLPSHQAAKQRAMIKQLTTGAFVREPELLEKESSGE